MKPITKEELLERLNDVENIKTGVRRGNSITIQPPMLKSHVATKIDNFFSGDIFELEDRERILGFDYEIPGKGRTLLIRTRP